MNDSPYNPTVAEAREEAIAEASERLRGIEGPTFHGVGDKRHISEREYADAVTLAIAWLEEHPADDGESVTEGWLRAVGFEKSSLPFMFTIQSGEGGEIQVGVTLPEEGMEEADSLWVQGELAIVGPTRGDVRRLLAALGIPLAAARTEGR